MTTGRCAAAASSRVAGGGGGGLIGVGQIVRVQIPKSSASPTPKSRGVMREGAILRQITMEWSDINCVNLSVHQKNIVSLFNFQRHFPHTKTEFVAANCC